MALILRLVSGSSAKRPEPSGINAMPRVQRILTGQPCVVGGKVWPDLMDRSIEAVQPSRTRKQPIIAEANRINHVTGLCQAFYRHGSSERDRGGKRVARIRSHKICRGNIAVCEKARSRSLPPGLQPNHGAVLKIPRIEFQQRLSLII